MFVGLSVDCFLFVCSFVLFLVCLHVGRGFWGGVVS